jgi:hypothetical protein
MLFTRVALCTESKGLLIGGPLLSKKLMLFTCVAPRTESNGLPVGSPLSSEKHAFYTCSTAYKKQGTPNQCFTHLLLLLARASPRTESKGLYRYVLQIQYFINEVSRSFCSSAGVIIPLYHPNNKPSDPDRRFNILLIYNYYQYTRIKGHLFIFIFIKFIQHAKEKDYRALGLSLSSDSARLVKLYEDTKS